ncbi:MAG: hypothetical protein ACKN9S_12435 [Pirellula sp.]
MLSKLLGFTAFFMYATQGYRTLGMVGLIIGSAIGVTAFFATDGFLAVMLVHIPKFFNFREPATILGGLFAVVYVVIVVGGILFLNLFIAENCFTVLGGLAR